MPAAQSRRVPAHRARSGTLFPHARMRSFFIRFPICIYQDRSKIYRYRSFVKGRVRARQRRDRRQATDPAGEMPPITGIRPAGPQVRSETPPHTGFSDLAYTGSQSREASRAGVQEAARARNAAWGREPARKLTVSTFGRRQPARLRGFNHSRSTSHGLAAGRRARARGQAPVRRRARPAPPRNAIRSCSAAARDASGVEVAARPQRGSSQTSSGTRPPSTPARRACGSRSLLRVRDCRRRQQLARLAPAPVRHLLAFAEAEASDQHALAPERLG